MLSCVDRMVCVVCDEYICQLVVDVYCVALGLICVV